MSAADQPAGKATAVVPYLMVRDPDRLREFYEKAFGFELAERVPDDKGKTAHIGMLFQGWRVVMFAGKDESERSGDCFTGDERCSGAGEFSHSAS